MSGLDFAMRSRERVPLTFGKGESVCLAFRKADSGLRAAETTISTLFSAASEFFLFLEN